MGQLSEDNKRLQDDYNQMVIEGTSRIQEDTKAEITNLKEQVSEQME